MEDSVDSQGDAYNSSPAESMIKCAHQGDILLPFLCHFKECLAY